MKQSTIRRSLLLALSAIMCVAMIFGIGTLTHKASAAGQRDARESSVGVYNEALYGRDMARPYWEGNIMYNETVLMLTDGTKDGTGAFVYTGKLLYNPVQVLSVMNHDRTVTYTEGVDFTLNGTQILSTSLQGLHSSVTNSGDTSWINANEFTNVGSWQDPRGISGNNYCVLENSIYTEGNLFRERYLQVSYIYNFIDDAEKTAHDAVLTQHDANQLTGLRAKLEAGQDISMLTIGDSITAGSSSTGETLHVAPYQPSYTTLVAQEIERVYGVNVNIVRCAVGGTESDYLLSSGEYHTDYVSGTAGQGAASFNTALANNEFDLAIIAYGMNDQGANRSKASYKHNIKATADKLLADSPNCNIVFINTFPRSPMADAYAATQGNTRSDRYAEYLAALAELSSDYDTTKGSDMSRVINMYSVGNYFMNTRGKAYSEISSSNYNHPNDFFHRIYAQNVMAAITDYATLNVYEMNKLGGITPLFDIANVDANGWSMHEQDSTNFEAGAVEQEAVAYENRQLSSTGSTDEARNVIYRRFGITANSHNYANGVSSFRLYWAGHTVNFNAYDVTKPIVIKYAVNPQGAGEMLEDGFHYALSLYPSLYKAFRSGSELVKNASQFMNIADFDGGISLRGSNGTTTQNPNANGDPTVDPRTGEILADLYGKLRINNDASKTTKKFFKDGLNGSNWQNEFYSIVINIGTKNTTVTIEGEQFTLDDVTRADFPDGVAYLKAMCAGNVAFRFADASMKTEYYQRNKDTGVIDYNNKFDYAMDANGWSSYVQVPNIDYVDSTGKTAIHSVFGRESSVVTQGYSAMTLLNAAYTANFRAIDVTQPINIKYYMHPGRVGAYTFALFEDIDTMLAAMNSTWQHSNVGAKISFHGANQDYVMYDYELNNRLVFNKGEAYYDNDVFPADYVNNFATRDIEVVFEIGAYSTAVFVNGRYTGSLAVKRSDFSEGVAYISLAAINGEAAIMCREITTDSATYVQEDTYDGNGWYFTHHTASGVAGKGLYSYENATTDTGTLMSSYVLQNTYVYNKFGFNLDREIKIYFTINDLIEANKNGQFFIGIFDSIEDIKSSGINSWQLGETTAKLMFNGGTGTKSERYGKIRLMSQISDQIGGDADADYLDGDMSVLRIYIAENEEDSYVYINDTLFAGKNGNQDSGNPLLGISRANFADDYAFIQVLGTSITNEKVMFTIAATSAPSVGIDSVNITLSDSIGLNVKARIDTSLSNLTARFTYRGLVYYVNEYNVKGDIATFRFTKVSPQFLNLPISVYLTAQDLLYDTPVEIGRIDEYSIRDYCETVLIDAKEEYDKKAKDVIVDLLNYGAAGQIYTADVNFNDTDLANKNLSTKGGSINVSGYGTNYDELEEEEKPKSVLERTSHANFAWAAARLALGNRANIDFYLATKDLDAASLANVSVNFHRAGANDKVVQLSECQTTIYKGTECYVVRYDNISPMSFANEITATVYMNGEATTSQCTYSVDSWIAGKVNGATASEAEINFAKAMYCYGKSALAYAIPSGNQISYEYVQYNGITGTIDFVFENNFNVETGYVVDKSKFAIVDKNGATVDVSRAYIDGNKVCVESSVYGGFKPGDRLTFTKGLEVPAVGITGDADSTFTVSDATAIYQFVHHTVSLLPTSVTTKIPEVEVQNVNHSSKYGTMRIAFVEATAEKAKADNLIDTTLRDENGESIYQYFDASYVEAYDKYGAQKTVTALRTDPGTRNYLQVAVDGGWKLGDRLVIKAGLVVGSQMTYSDVVYVYGMAGLPLDEYTGSANAPLGQVTVLDVEQVTTGNYTLITLDKPSGYDYDYISLDQSYLEYTDASGNAVEVQSFRTALDGEKIQIQLKSNAPAENGFTFTLKDGLVYGNYMLFDAVSYKFNGTAWVYNGNGENLTQLSEIAIADSDNGHINIVNPAMQGRLTKGEVYDSKYHAYITVVDSEGQQKAVTKIFAGDANTVCVQVEGNIAEGDRVRIARGIVFGDYIYTGDTLTKITESGDTSGSGTLHYTNWTGSMTGALPSLNITGITYDDSWKAIFLTVANPHTYNVDEAMLNKSLVSYVDKNGNAVTVTHLRTKHGSDAIQLFTSGKVYKAGDRFTINAGLIYGGYKLRTTLNYIVYAGQGTYGSGAASNPYLVSPYTGSMTGALETTRAAYHNGREYLPTLGANNTYVSIILDKTISAPTGTQLDLSGVWYVAENGTGKAITYFQTANQNEYEIKIYPTAGVATGDRFYIPAGLVIGNKVTSSAISYICCADGIFRPNLSGGGAIKSISTVTAAMSASKAQVYINLGVSHGLADNVDFSHYVYALKVVDKYGASKAIGSAKATGGNYVAVNLASGNFELGDRIQIADNAYFGAVKIATNGNNVLAVVNTATSVPLSPYSNMNALSGLNFTQGVVGHGNWGSLALLSNTSLDAGYFDADQVINLDKSLVVYKKYNTGATATVVDFRIYSGLNDVIQLALNAEHGTAYTYFTRFDTVTLKKGLVFGTKMLTADQTFTYRTPYNPGVQAGYWDKVTTNPAKSELLINSQGLSGGAWVALELNASLASANAYQYNGMNYVTYTKSASTPANYVIRAVTNTDATHLVIVVDQGTGDGKTDSAPYAGDSFLLKAGMPWGNSELKQDVRITYNADTTFTVAWV